MLSWLNEFFHSIRIFSFLNCAYHFPLDFPYSTFHNSCKKLNIFPMQWDSHNDKEWNPNCKNQRNTRESCWILDNAQWNQMCLLKSFHIFLMNKLRNIKRYWWKLKYFHLWFERTFNVGRCFGVQKKKSFKEILFKAGISIKIAFSFIFFPSL